MKKISTILRTNWTYLIGGSLGAIGGYIYWLKVGCLTGNCPLTASPTPTIIWTAVLGMFLFSFLKRDKE